MTAPRCRACRRPATTLIALHGGASIFTCDEHHAAVTAAHAGRVSFTTPTYDPDLDDTGRYTGQRWGAVPGQLTMIGVDDGAPDSITSISGQRQPSLFDPTHTEV